MKYCTHCGKELFDEAVICVGCGCPVGNAQSQSQQPKSVNGDALINTLAQRVQTNAIIWLVIGIIQVLAGIYASWFVIIVGVLNIISSVRDMNYCKTLDRNSTGIVAKFEPLAGPIITLIYNLVIGGVIGVVGSIYYFFGIRNFVMENKQFFLSLDYKDQANGCQPSATWRQKSVPAEEGMWICQNCGTQNKSAYGQCKRCGQYRGK